MRPSDHQPDLPLDRLLIREPPGAEAVPMDVLFVGGGPAGLAGAIELRRLVREDKNLGDLEIGVLEKASALGEHCLSGAVVKPGPFRELFPDVSDAELPFRRPAPEDRVYLLTEKGKLRIPTPPTMRNRGHYIASICEIVRWMGERAEAAGVSVFTGFPADALLVDRDRVVGVRTTPSGLDRAGKPASGYAPPTDVAAKVTVLAEGPRGSLTQAFLRWQGISSPNPQIYALGVKELWETKKTLDAVIHTLGWPLPADTFGGSFIYPLADRLVALGLVVGLDYPASTFDVHARLQKMKQHPLLAELLDGGELIEWGAKTIPEGGYWSLPARWHGDGVLIVGDSAGFVEVSSLKGIHYAVQSGILAARSIYEAWKEGDTSTAGLRRYDAAVRSSFIHADLRRTRNMRLAFKSGLYVGGLKAACMALTRGAFPGGRIAVTEDAQVERRAVPAPQLVADGVRSLSKQDAVFGSGNTTRDDLPRHIVVPEKVPPDVVEFYSHMCPAGVYERRDGALVVNAPNCIDCKATDVLGPRWTPREGGSGPKYKRM